MAKTWTVKMGDQNLGDVFVPPSLTIAVGDTVRWVNDDSDPHTATSNGHTGETQHCTPKSSEDFHGEVEPGGTPFEHTFVSTGCFNYHCEFHGLCSVSEAPKGMIGTIMVW
jgi:plastocyanin